jgi:hypothetical protein
MKPDVVRYGTARVPYVMVICNDEREAFEDIQGQFRADRRQWTMHTWSLADGLRTAEGKQISLDSSPGPMALRWFSSTNLPERSILIVFGADAFLSPQGNQRVSPEVIQTILTLRRQFSYDSRLVIFLSNHEALPQVLKRSVSLVDWPLPDFDELSGELQRFVEGLDDDQEALFPDGRDAVIMAGLGMTRFEFSNAVALSWSVHGQVLAAEIRKAKDQHLRESSALEVEYPTVGFERLLGYENAKFFVSRIAKSPLSRGCLALGPPGCGKTTFARALAAELGLTFIKYNMSSVFTSRLGETEARAAIKVVEAHGRCLLLLDEIDKAFGGAASSAYTDGGAMLRVAQDWLTFMSDRGDGGPFIWGTCNDYAVLSAISGGALVRAGRWDGTLFFDFPTSEERKAIFQYYRKRYPKVRGRAPDMDLWSGAEIEQLVRTAEMLQVPLEEAAKYINPIGRSRKQEFDEFREWARSRTIPASVKPDIIAEALKKKKERR